MLVRFFAVLFRWREEKKKKEIFNICLFGEILLIEKNNQGKYAICLYPSYTWSNWCPFWATHVFFLSAFQFIPKKKKILPFRQFPHMCILYLNRPSIYSNILFFFFVLFFLIQRMYSHLKKTFIETTPKFPYYFFKL